MMDLAWLWESSLRGSGLILLALCARCWANGRGRGKLPQWAVAGLWTAAALRLLAPGNLAIPVAGRPLALNPAQTAIGGNGGFAWLIQAVWAAGAGFLLVCLLLRAWLAHRQIGRAEPLEDPFCRQLIAGQRLLRPARLLICGQIQSPLTCGLLRPKILLPRQMDFQDRQGLACALTHELVHIRRMDALRKGLVRAALCLHWFNPLAWMLACLADQDFELACDEKALSLLGPAQKGCYARALLRLAEQNNRSGPLYSGFSLAGQNGLEERIGSMMKYQKISRRTALAAALTVAAAATVSAAELKPVDPDVSAVQPAAAEAEYESSNSVEVNPSTATVKLENPDGSQDSYNARYAVTLEDGQQITYTLNHEHCHDVDGGVVYSVNHHGHHHN